MKCPLASLGLYGDLQPSFEQALEDVLGLIGNPEGRTGIYVAHSRFDGLVYACFAVGEPRLDKVSKYIEYACNKVQALGRCGFEHLTSYEIRNPDAKIVGGGLRTEDCQENWSASGLALEHEDACVVQLALRRNNLISAAWASSLAKRSKNELWAEVCEKYSI